VRGKGEGKRRGKEGERREKGAGGGKKQEGERGRREGKIQRENDINFIYRIILKKPKRVWWGQEIHGEGDRKKDETKCVTNVSLIVHQCNYKKKRSGHDKRWGWLVGL
jgi:hypothetical protein